MGNKQPKERITKQEIEVLQQCISILNKRIEKIEHDLKELKSGNKIKVLASI